MASGPLFFHSWEHRVRAKPPAKVLREAWRAATAAGDVVDFLVGHEGETVRDVHYGRELMEKARAAVDAMPAIDWVDPWTVEELGSNVVPFGRRR